MTSVINHHNFTNANGGVETRLNYIRGGVRMSAAFPEKLSAEEAVALINRLNRALPPDRQPPRA